MLRTVKLGRTSVNLFVNFARLAGNALSVESSACSISRRARGALVLQETVKQHTCLYVHVQRYLHLLIHTYIYVYRDMQIHVSIATRLSIHLSLSPIKYRQTCVCACIYIYTHMRLLVGIGII